jgi:hypothetical protein
VQIVEIEAETALRRQRTGSQALEASAVREQHPFDRPKRSKKSPAPLFHAASKAVRRELYEMHGWFVAAFREAARREPDGQVPSRYLPTRFAVRGCVAREAKESVVRSKRLLCGCSPR